MTLKRGSIAELEIKNQWLKEFSKFIVEANLAGKTH